MKQPRLQSLEINNFRSISGRWDVPLDGSVVLVHGDNGAGKSSLLSAIELAATGEIAYLRDSGDTTYARHLLHRGSDAGAVTLTVGDMLTGSARNSSTLVVNPKGQSGKPLLSNALAKHFSERCFLSQATLGRLLDVYAPVDQKRQQSTLISFVKELLGIDRLDALIAGLHSTIRIDYAQKKSRVWTGALADRSELDVRHKDDLARKAVLEDRMNRLRSELSLLVTSSTTQQGSEDASDTDLVPRIEQQLISIGDSEKGNQELARLQASVSIAKSILQAIGEPGNQVEFLFTDTLNIEVESAARAVEVWWEMNEDSVTSFAKKASQLLGATNTWRREHAAADVGRIISLLLGKLEVTDQQIQANDEKANRVRTLQEELKSLDARRKALKLQWDSLATSVVSGQLSDALAMILPSIDSPECPVCDQAFPDGKLGLEQHLRSKLSQLETQATLWRDIDSQLRECSTEMEQAQAELTRAEERVFEEPDLTKLRTLRGAIVTHLDQAPSIHAVVDEAIRLGDILISCQENATSAITRRAKFEELRNQIDAIEKSLGLRNERDFETFDSRLSYAEEAISNRRGKISAVMSGLQRIKEIFEAYKETSIELERAMMRSNSSSRQLAEVNGQLREARDRKEAASALRTKAEEIRSRVINSVFDQHLNSTWKEFFTRLVPNEPFIPQFDKQVKSERSISVKLTTVDRFGRNAGTPAAMLSHGNVNTAALSLFLSLHFVAHDELPWLILDDPIQSMDDIHIANFAALLKRISREQKRQVVVAVHQRELFDYLALELAPAAEGQSLIEVEISRHDGESVLSSVRTEYQPDTAVRRKAA
ncbi:AAA family ATPase [Pseudarthrobacter sp. NPDC055928]|uniref:AAA family ATPase n=1 Tax=Pseudarthrobacter sp. NPDC055928 TaxID=3345661 RepID=UPI0035DE4839